MTMEHSNNCIVERKFLFWKWKEVQHDYKLFSIRKFMYCSISFIVKYKCKRCGIEKENHFIEHDHLILKGISPDILNTIGTDEYFLNKQLKAELA